MVRKMVQWTAELDRKLFYAIMIQKNLSFSTVDHQELADMMGGECSQGAIRNRLGALKTTLKRDGLDVAAENNAKGGAAISHKKPDSESGTPTKAAAAIASTPRSRAKGKSKTTKKGTEDAEANEDIKRDKGKRRADDAFDGDDEDDELEHKAVKMEHGGYSPTFDDDETDAI